MYSAFNSLQLLRSCQWSIAEISVKDSQFTKTFVSHRDGLRGRIINSIPFTHILSGYTLLGIQRNAAILPLQTVYCIFKLISTLCSKKRH